MNIKHINSNIKRLTLPYKDIYTSIYTIKTDDGVLLFDSGSFDDDAAKYTLPFLTETGVKKDELKYIYISHNHTDHVGGLKELLKYFPDTVIVSQCSILKEKYDDYTVKILSEGDKILGVLKVISIPGHTLDSSALLDTRSKTLITGDCLQLYGIFGSGKWGSNIGYPDLHIEAINKLRNTEINMIITAHDYHPFGYKYEGNEEISKALDACIQPLFAIKEIIESYPSLTNEQISELYNSNGKLPTLSAHVVEAVRNKML